MEPKKGAVIVSGLFDFVVFFGYLILSTQSVVNEKIALIKDVDIRETMKQSALKDEKP